MLFLWMSTLVVNIYIDSVIVEDCYDGNSCIVSIGDKLLNVRLVAIDTPELPHKNHVGQPFALEAKQFLNGMIKGKAVHLNLYKWDEFDRFFGEMEISHHNVNMEMIQAGYAEVYRGENIIDTRFYEIAEQVARILKLNIWSNPSYMSPRDYRRMHGIIKR